MEEKSVIIIGAGLAGLSAGCYGQMNGFSTRIFEHHTRPGGLCTAWQRKGFTLDGCIHWLMSCQEGTSFRRMYDELGAFVGNRLEILREYGCFLEQCSGLKLEFTADIERLAADMHQLAPDDRGPIDEFIRCCLDLRGFDTNLPNPPELMNPWAHVKMMWQFRSIIRYLVKYSMPVAKYTERFRSPFLRACLNDLFLPDMPAYFLFIVMGQLIDGQLGYVEGSSQRFADAIAHRYQQLGGEIIYRSEVEQILVRDDRAAGVRLADGSEHYADFIVSAADAHRTIFSLLEGRYVDDRIRKRFKDWPLFQPIILISYGVDRSYAGQNAANFVLLKEPLQILEGAIDRLFLRIYNYDFTLAPPGKTVLQVYVPSDFDSWNQLAADQERYSACKDQIAAAVLARLEEIYPGTADKVEVTDVATPYTFWRYTFNYRGSYEGWLMTRQAFNTLIPKTLPGLDNFYMAGQWVEPGGGIPPVLYSGRNAIRIICRRLGREFTASLPVGDA